MIELISAMKKTVVFLGRPDSNCAACFYATGFLLNINKVHLLITAKHCVVEANTGKFIDSGMHAFYNLKNGGVGFRSIDELKDKNDFRWIFHKNPEVDVAIIPFLLDTKIEDVVVIPDEIFWTEDLFELYDVFFFSFQPGINVKTRITPIIRNGIISLMNDDSTFYIDAAAFPGNSGSPVFLKPSPIKFTDKGFHIGKKPFGGQFIGMIGSYLPYQETAISMQTGRPRVIFEENTGLSKVWSVHFFNEIINSKEFENQINKILEEYEKKGRQTNGS